MPDQHPLHAALQRLCPRYGWLAFVLLVGTLACLIFSVLEVEWVPADRVIIPATVFGFVAAAVMAQRSMRATVAWLLLILGGVSLAIFLAAELWPPLSVLSAGGAAVLEYWRLYAALFADRAFGWWRAVDSGGRSTETAVFTLGLALAAWFVAAALAWSAYRARRPYVGLTLVGFALAANTFYGRAGLYWVVFFFGLAAMAGTYFNYLYREIEWDRKGVDYSSEVRIDLLLYTAGVSLGIMSLAMALPAINFRAIADTFQRQGAVVAAERTVARVFAGVAQPRTDEGAVGAGGLPRSFLLGGDPELTETVVMTATVRPELGVTAGDLAGFHWRSVSYDLYTGRGWRRSPEREENVGSGEAIPSPEEASERGRAIVAAQEVGWTYDRRATRYTLGRPVVFSHDLIAQWRGLDDLVGVRGRNNAPLHYTAETRLILATPDELRAARLSDTPPEIRARYTELPDTIPDRVYELARQAAGLSSNDATDPSVPSPSPYDQARAIEQFLRQYPYSLDLPTPPADSDIVDYFLFDLQRGFCDYFASAMVVMARAVGLPARLGVGFLQQPPDADGVQTIRQINAHSWAEVYFAGYGWVEFEPTAPFAAAASAPPTTVAAQATFTPPQPAGVAIPRRAPQRETPWLLLLGTAVLALVTWRLWGRQIAERLRGSGPELNDVQLAFANLLEGAAAIGYPPHPGQTPAEFAAALLDQPTIAEYDEQALRPAVERLTDLFAAHQYGRANPAVTGAEASATWTMLRAHMRRLAWRRRFDR